MDTTVIPLALYGYGVILFLMAAAPQRRWLNFLLFVALPLRLFCTGLRTSIGSDIEPYTEVLARCDLSSINSLELFWYVACLPSQWLDGIVSFPFFWVGLLDCILFVYLVRLGGWRAAALHDMIYLPATSMGAVRQALAMKIVFLAVLLYRRHKEERNHGAGLLLATPFIHLAAIVPTLAVTFATAKTRWRIVILVALVALGAFMTRLVDDTLVEKVLFYLEFEGFRTLQDMYASWVKRGLVVVICLVFMSPAPTYWALYAVALLFAASEFYAPEVAVRIGAYFEQFEVLLLTSPMKSNLRKLGPPLYALIAFAYTARFLANIGSLPK